MLSHFVFLDDHDLSLRLVDHLSSLRISDTKPDPNTDDNEDKEPNSTPDVVPLPFLRRRPEIKVKFSLFSQNWLTRVRLKNEGQMVKSMRLR